MKQYRFPDNRIGKIGFVLFLFVMLLLARDTLITTCVLGFARSQLLMLGLMAAAGLVFLWANRRQWKALLTDKRLLVLLLSTMLILLPMLIKRDWQIMYFSVLLCLYFAVFLTFFISYREVARYYVVILCALGVYSIVATYLLRLLPDNGMGGIPAFENSTGWDFYNFGLAFVSITNSKGRNFGIFREPGVYQFFLLVGLYLNNYAVTWKKNWQLWLVNILLAVTMLTTFATGGVIEMGLFAVVLFFEKRWYRDKRARVLAAALVLAGMAGIVLIFAQGGTLAYELTGMVEKLFSNTDSTDSRIGAILLDLEIFLRNPLVGERLSTVLHMVEHNTTSTMIQYAAFGFFTGSLHVLAWAALVWEKERRLWANLALLVILFMSFNTQNLIADVFFWLFPYMALVERGIPLCRKVTK